MHIEKYLSCWELYSKSCLLQLMSQVSYRPCLVGWNGIEKKSFHSFGLLKCNGIVIPLEWGFHWNGDSTILVEWAFHPKTNGMPFHSKLKFIFHKYPHMPQLHSKNTLLSKNNILLLYIILMIYKYYIYIGPVPISASWYNFIKILNVSH